MRRVLRSVRAAATLEPRPAPRREQGTDPEQLPQARSRHAVESGIGSPVRASSGTSPAAAANSVAYFGSWLDDASLVNPGRVWVSLATGYWRGAGNRRKRLVVCQAPAPRSHENHDRVSLTGSLGQSYGRTPARQTALGLGASVTMTPTTGIFIGVGHTGVPPETGPGGLSIAGGLSFFVSDPKTP